MGFSFFKIKIFLLVDSFYFNFSNNLFFLQTHVSLFVILCKFFNNLKFIIPKNSYSTNFFFVFIHLRLLATTGFKKFTTINTSFKYNNFNYNLLGATDNVRSDNLTKVKTDYYSAYPATQLMLFNHDALNLAFFDQVYVANAYNLYFLHTEREGRFFDYNGLPIYKFIVSYIFGLRVKYFYKIYLLF